MASLLAIEARLEEDDMMEELSSQDKTTRKNKPPTLMDAIPSIDTHIVVLKVYHERQQLRLRRGHSQLHQRNALDPDIDTNDPVAHGYVCRKVMGMGVGLGMDMDMGIGDQWRW